MWALAWAQIGIKDIRCVAWSEQALDQLWQIKRDAPFRESIVETTNISVKDGLLVISLHFSSATSFGFDRFKELLHQLQVSTDSWICFLSAPIGLKNVKQAAGPLFKWRQLRHTALGGLTNARLEMGIATNRQSSQLLPRVYPKRPLNRFLDPVARFTAWRQPKAEAVDCWFPNREAKPYPWPWKRSPQWVETHSVLLQGTIQRHFTEKEKCQLLDLRSDWVNLVPCIYRWADGAAPPLRLYIETIVMARRTFWQVNSEGTTSGEPLRGDEVKIGKDWGRTRPPKIDVENDIPTDERRLYFGWYWSPNDTLDIAVAARSDDAEVDLTLWAVGGPGELQEKARGIIRTFLLRVWKRKICKEALHWLASTDTTQEERRINQAVISDCIWRCTESSWWNWDSGSSLLFWRWPPLWQKEARDGSRGFHTKLPRPRLHFPQVPIEEQWVVEKDKEKLEKLLRRKYIISGHCLTTVPRFPVPKGEDDIRVVWDLAKNGMNETMYTPTFFLATMHTYTRRIEAGFYGGDFDVGEQFHNYPLHPTEQVYCGVQVPTEMVTALNTQGLDIQPYMRWSRLVFGWQSSPYMALRMFSRVIELAKGKPDDSTSAFQWDKVVLNLPGSPAYNPGRPRVMKITNNGQLACDIVTFYDDGRVSGPTEELAHKALRQITSKIQYYGNQDAARKRRQISQRPGAWAGGVAYTDQNLLRVFVSQIKWDKAKDFIKWISDLLQDEKPIERKRFQSGKGFLVYMSMCYEYMLPYMKGFHLSEDSWRTHRDDDGWKLNKNKQVVELDDDIFDDELFVHEALLNCSESNSSKAPKTVLPVPRLKDDVHALQKFFEPPTPVQVIVRPVGGSNLVIYGGGDASGEGYGGQLQPIGQKAVLRRGFWCPKDSEESSNWRELRNLIDTLKAEALTGNLAGQEVWLATDNSTAANAYYRGTSSSRLLHEMITELRLLTIQGNFLLHIYHIAGTRMIESGIDALSRGELQVSSLDQTVQTVMPLHLSPIDRAPNLVDWLNTWLDVGYQICKPSDWFYNAHQGGETTENLQSKTWVWDLPPGAALHAIEELGFARLKRHNILRGVVLVPQLLTTEWFRRFTRIVDFFFVIPAGGIPEWPNTMHEPLTVGIYLPLFRHAPWDWKCVPFLVPLGGTLSTLPGEDFLIYRPVDEDGEELHAPGEELDFMEARAGDHLFCPFECDECVFFRLRSHSPVKGNPSDTKLLRYIRRANLDAFWSRRPGTVNGLNNIFMEQAEVGEDFGFEMFGPLGPFGRYYDSGMKAAIGILKRSQRPGHHEAKMKYSSVRKARSVHTDVFNASAKGTQDTMVWRSDRARFVATKAPTDTAWFNCFMTGFKARVGERRKQDAAISIALMMQIQQTLEDDWEDALGSYDAKMMRQIAEYGAFYLFLYCGSLRGFEGPKVVLTDLKRQIAAPGSKQAELYGPHIYLPLTGRFKARSQDSRNILIPVAYETASGLLPGLWAERLVQVLLEENITTGWAFQDSTGDQLKMSNFDEDFYDRLNRIQHNKPELFTEGINISDDFHLARSFRRGATTRATAAGVSGTDIDYINRWNIGAEGSGPMRVLYADRVQLTKTFLRFSLAL